jgi:hypothetical protein
MNNFKEVCMLNETNYKIFRQVVRYNQDQCPQLGEIIQTVI